MWIWPVVNESMSRLCASPFWDSNVTWNTPNPDFTQCFEKTFLVWFPCLFLWLCVPLEVYNLRRSKACDISFNLYNISKLVLIVLIGLPSSINIVNFIFFDERQIPVDILSPLIEFLTICLLFLLSYANIKCGIRSSGILFIFSLLLVLFKAPQFRTELETQSNILHSISKLILFNRYDGTTYLREVSYPLVILLLILNCFSDAPPNFRIYPVDENVYPEYHSSFISQLFFAWFDTFIWKGYKKSLTDEDLWNLEHEAKSAQISHRLESEWYSALQRLKKETITNIGVHNENDESLRNERLVQEPGFEEAMKKASIVGPLLKTFGPYFMISVLIEVGLIGLTFASPQILKVIIAFVQEKEEYLWHGYFYAILLFVVVVLETLLSARTSHVVTTTGLYIRTSLTSLIYKKALKVSNGARRYFTVAEIINLMAIDVQRFTGLMSSINLVWSVPLKICLTLYFLWNILGPSVLAGLAVMITLIPANGLMASKLKNLQLKQMKYKDERLRVINEMLSGIKVLKLYAWEPCFEKRINHIRAKEMAVLKSSIYLYTVTSFLWACTPFLVSSVTFAVYVLSSDRNILDAKVAFVSLSLFNILRSPMTSLPYLITRLAQTTVSVKRINKFLNSEELDPNAVSHQPNLEPIIVEDGQFSWEGYDGPFVLNHINVTVRSGQLVAVVGPVGSGKSSLLHALLGDMYKQSGFVNTTGRLAYVPQQAWIRNTTFKGNITFGDLSNQSCYEKILEACALNADLKALPKGDKTLIGEKGINLSGGQKQRVSLARAVYAEADIYLMDDPLSSVDSHVGKHLFERIIGPKGMLNKKTRILVTHNVTYLPQVDFIIVMKDGIISESGTYHELERKGGNFSEFLATYVKNENNDFDDYKGIENLPQEFTDQHSGDDEDATVISGCRKRKKSQSEDQTELNTSSEAIEQNCDEIEKIETGNVDRKVFAYYFNAMGMIFIVVTVFMNIMFHAFLVASNFWLTVWTKNTSNSLDIAKKSFYLGIYGLFGLGQAFSDVTRFLCLFYGAVKASLKIHAQLLESFLRWPMYIFDITPAGRILNRFSNDMDVIDMDLPSTLDSFIYDSCSVISTLIVISYTTPLFIIVTIPVGIIYTFLQRFYVATSRQLKRLESVSRSPICSQSGETILGAQSIRAYGLQTKFIQIFENRIDCNQRSYYASMISNRWLSVRLEMIGDLVIFFSALFTVFDRDILSAGLAGLSVTYALQIMEGLNGMLRNTSGLETNIVAVERIREYKDIDREALWKQQNESVSADWPETGEISMENFHGRYREGLQLVLEDVTFHVPGGEKVGIVGRTGAGKTSLSLSLFRIIESDSGRILIDGVDISKIGLHTLRNRLTTIPQDPVLFSGTLRFNLDPMEEYSDECIWRALELAHMKTYVSGLGFGLQSKVAESGDNFSVGQRQLICLARALLRKTKILILDEATAAIDLVIDDLIQATIRKEFKDCTILTIAHRINTILDYDRIIVMDGGRVMEFDSPKTLLKSKNSIFYQMALKAGAV